MSDDGAGKVKPFEPGDKIVGFVAGGGAAPSTSEEREIAFWKADAERRRAEQDRERELAQRGGARRQTLDLGSPTMHPVVVMKITIAGHDEYAQCDVVNMSTDGKMDLALVVPCPGCLRRGYSTDQAQIHIKQSHRKWSLDRRHEGKLWVDPETGQAYRLAGKPVGEETYICSRCRFSFVIDDRADTGHEGVSWMRPVRALHGDDKGS